MYSTDIRKVYSYHGICMLKVRVHCIVLVIILYYGIYFVYMHAIVNIDQKEFTTFKHEIARQEIRLDL